MFGRIAGGKKVGFKKDMTFSRLDFALQVEFKQIVRTSISLTPFHVPPLPYIFAEGLSRNQLTMVLLYSCSPVYKVPN